MNLDPIMEELGQTWGTPPPRSDSLGRYQIVVNGELVIQLEPSPYQEGVYLYGLLGEVPAAMAEAAFELALTENLFGKGTGPTSIGLDPHSRQLCLFQHISTTPTSYAQLEEALSTFASYLERWQRRMEELFSGMTLRRAL